MPGDVLLRALGLITSPNILDPSIGPGGLLEASNVIITRNNVIQPRRGFKLYGNSFGTVTDRAKQLMTYQSRILRHYSNKLGFDTGTVNEDGQAIFQDFDGTYVEPASNRRIRFIEANQNLYFTTNEGIKKISASSAAGLTSASGFITQAGGIKALDLSARLKIVQGNQSGFLPQDSAVAYRVLWNIKDANTNLVQGTPSQRAEIFNSLLSLVLLDFITVLGALDDIGAGVTADTNLPGTLIDNKNYISTLGLESDASAGSLQANLLSLTNKIDNDIKYADDVSNAPLQLGATSASITTGVCTITFSSGDPTNYFVTGSKIFLAGYTATTGSINGAQIITGTTSSTITFNTSATGPVSQSSPTIVSNEYRSISQPAVPSIPPTDAELVALQTYLNLIISRLQSENSFVIDATLQTNYIAPLTITTSANVILDITVPEEVTLNHFYQIYRSDTAQATGTTVLSDLSPNDEMKLVFEGFPTQAQLDAGVIEVEDVVIDTFRGANLYTNPESGEGILQSNDVPPFALDINRFKNVVFYANTRTRHRVNLNLLGIENMLSDYDAGTTSKVNITDTDKNNTYAFIEGKAQKTQVTCTAGGTLNASGTASYWLLNAANDLNQYYVWYKIGTATDPSISGKTGIKVLASAGDTATQIATKTRDSVNRILLDFNVVSSTSVDTVTNVNVGYTTPASAGTTSFTFNVVTSGQGEKVTQEITDFAMVAGSTLNGSGSGNYFTLNATFDRPEYYVWYQKGTSTDPAVSGRTGIQVTVLNTDTAPQVATKTMNAINAFAPEVFIASVVSSTLTVKNFYPGPVSDATVGTMPGGFTKTVTQQGALEVLLSNQISPAQAVDETARSFIRVINRNKNDAVNGFYLSGAQDVPGKMLIEARVLNQLPVYILGNNSNTGESFSPDISPEKLITNITAASPTHISVANHGFVNGTKVIISGTNSLPNIDGAYTVTVVDANTFSIPVQVNTSGNKGGIILQNDATVSDNEVKSHRIYYSKILQPEAVPIVNFVDVGSENKAILRIFPLRDSLFIFKEDGLWRISGETAPWTVSLFDSSVILMAPDSLDVSNNVLYGWTNKGIMTATEAGADVITRVIDVDILPKATPNFPNFKAVTWGIGYESDNSYVVWTTKNQTDDIATIAYRYSTLTQTWTTYDKTNTCGVIHPTEDKLYLGAGDTNFLEQERKTFSRLDYADREISTALLLNNLLTSGQQNLYLIKLTDISTVKPGDVLIQEQLLTTYEYNTLLRKLDADPGTGFKDYLATLVAGAGDDLRQKLVGALIGLAPKLDADPGLTDTDYASSIVASTGSITNISAADPTEITTSAPHNLLTGRWIRINGSNSSPSVNGVWQVTVTGLSTFTIDTSVLTAGTTATFETIENDFRDIRACYNIITDKLNSDTGTVFKNYLNNTTTTIQESIIIAVNPTTNIVTLSIQLPYVIGPLTIFSSIVSTFTFRPHTFEDPLSWKHIREAQLCFENTAFTSAKLAFSSDLLPQFKELQFSLKGNGIFGSANFGTNFFGGTGNAITHRTYIPRDYQRCRYLNLRFTHNTAREAYAFLGYTFTGEVGLSSRAYRS